MSGYGFWGVLCLLKIIDDIIQSNLVINPNHPDKFGGLKALISLGITGSSLFSSGALLFPIAFEVIDSLGSNILVEYLCYVAMGLFILFVLLGFFVPLSKIRERAGTEKTKKILDSEAKLQAMSSKYLLDLNKDISIEKLAQVYQYTQQHLRLYEMKGFPVELKTFLEMLSSIVVPLGIFLLQVKIR